MFKYIINQYNIFKEKRDFKKKKKATLKLFASHERSKIIYHDDHSISVVKHKYSDIEYSYLFLTNKMVDENGELKFKIKEIGNLYCNDIKLSSTKNFPDIARSIDFKNTGIKRIDLKCVKKHLSFDSNVIDLRIKQIDDDFVFNGDFSNLETLAYLPTSIDFIMYSPFKELHYDKLEFDDEGKSTNGYEVLEKFPRTGIYLEYLLLNAKPQYSKIEKSNKSDYKKLFSSLFWKMENKDKILGVFEPYKNYFDTIKWSKDFLTKDFKDSAKVVTKFNL